MAARLSVVLVQSRPAAIASRGRSAGSPRSADRILEQVVGALIGISGVDLTLVGPPEQLPESSTDRLTLEKLSGDLAVLDWQTPADIMGSLAAIDFEGQRVPHARDAEAALPSGGGRRIYAFDMNQFATAEEVVDAILALKASRQVRTFSLAPVSPAAPTPAAGRPPRTSQSRPTAPADTSSTPPVIGPPAASGPAPPPAAPPQRSPPLTAIDLDDLLHELDRLDP
jgi:hypothetical protein